MEIDQTGNSLNECWIGGNTTVHRLYAGAGCPRKTIPTSNGVIMQSTYPTKRTRKGVAKWYKKQPKKPVKRMVDVDPLMSGITFAEPLNAR